jgi:hypothetical protein
MLHALHNKNKHILNMELDEMFFQLHVSAVLSSFGNSLSYRMERIVGGPQGRSEQCGEGPACIEPRLLDSPVYAAA